MIRREEENGWLLITQHEHAELAGEIMEYWGNEMFSVPEPRDEVLFAISEHDAGWRQWDASPKVDAPSGHPANFSEMDTRDQSEIWEHCFRDHEAEHPYASILIALHFAKFNQHNLDRDPSDENSRMLKSELGKFIKDKAGVELNGFSLDEVPRDIKVNLKLLQIGDIVSLTLCHGWKSIEIMDAPIDYSGDSRTLKMESGDGLNFTVEPYPFSEPQLNFSILCRRVAAASFANDAEYRHEYENAELEKLYFKISQKD